MAAQFNITIDWIAKEDNRLENVKRIFCELNKSERMDTASFSFQFKISQLRYLVTNYPISPFGTLDRPIPLNFASECAKMGTCDLAGFHNSLC